MQWSWPADGAPWKELWGRYKYVLLVILVGVFLLLLPDGQTGTERSSAVCQRETAFDLEAMEGKLEHALGQIQGAGEVTVVLTLQGSSRQIVAQDTELSQGTQRSTAVVISQGAGVQQTVPLQSIYPKYQGALVVCTGAGDARVKLQLLEAVRALTGLSTEKISICKR